MSGWPALRAAIAAKVKELYGVTVSTDDEITVTSGATEALFSAIQAVVQAGDEVILLEPAYDSYEPAVQLAGGRVVRVPLQRPAFAVDWDHVRDALSPRTRLVVVNSPHNPSGAVFGPGDLETLAALLAGSDALVLSDEVYEHMVFDGQPHRSLLGHPELASRSFVVSSFGKTYHATGWKVGYCVAPAALTAEFRKVHQFTTFAVNTPVQHALADFLQGNPAFHQRLPAFYQGKRDLFCRLLEGSRFRLHPARSTFFQILDYGAISDEHDVALARRWTEEIGVASIPLSVFCEQPFTGTRLRFCFAKDDATLEAACEKLRSL